MTEQELRKQLVEKAAGYIGYNESDGSFEKIIDIYNAHEPLARGYKVTYTDEWCATFASAIAILMNLTDIIPTECGCAEQVRLFADLGSWQEDESYIPAAGDYIFYDWDDSGSGDNTGNPDHVGIVEQVVSGQITVIEGNKDNSVGRRTIEVNGHYIRGYGIPDYAGKADSGGGTSPGPASGGQTDEEQIYIVKAGDTLSAIASQYGITYQELASYNGISDPDSINVGQEIRIPGSGNTTYIVKSGDSLWKIAEALLGDGTRYTEIMTLNGLSSETISPGQVLKIPGHPVQSPAPNPIKDDWVQRLQKEIGAEADGIAGPETLSKCPMLESGSQGSVVSLYQERLNDYGYSCGNVDGIFGTEAKAATMEYQGANELAQDGIVGEETWSKVLGLS